MAEDPRTEDVLRNLSKLVECLAGPNATAAERRTLEQYAVFKIRKHRNMATNGHEVKRSIDNMVDRFRTEGMANQAEAVRHLSSLILDDESWKGHYEVDVEYSVIDFLIHMAYEPIQIVRRNRSQMDQRLIALRDALKAASQPVADAPKAKPEHAEPEIDWVTLLSEDFIQLPSQSCDSESSLSDWSDETSSRKSSAAEIQPESMTTLPQKDMAEVYANSRNYPIGANTFLPDTTRRPKKNVCIMQPKSISFSSNRTRPSWCTLPKLPPLQPPKPAQSYTEFQFEPGHLAKTIHSDWWRPDISINTTTPNANPCANFAIAYVQHMNLGSRLKGTLPNTISESCLLREIIFMFFEPVSCCFFEVQPELMQITVRPNVSICSVSNDTLKSVLEAEVLPALQAMQQLRRIIKELTLPNSFEPSTGTLECFAVGLRQLLEPIVQRLIAYERRLLDRAAGKPEPGLTLIGFLRHMAEQFQLLQALQPLAAKALVKAPPHLRSAYLLTQLSELSRVHVPHQKLATALLLTALKRYCAIIDNWWRHAELDDCRDEYIVECYRDGWVPAGQRIRERSLPPDVTEAHQEIITKLHDCSFYNLLKSYALESGETQDLLADLNLLGDLVKGSQPLGALHSDLVGQLFEELNKLGANICPVGRRRRRSDQEMAREQLQRQDEQLLKNAAQLCDPELIGLFTQRIRCEGEHQRRTEQETLEPQLLDVLDALEKSTPLQLPQLVPIALDKVLRQRCQLANVYVMRWYREELLLGEHVRFLRHVFLLEGDSVLYPFYINLFRQIESGHNWSMHSQLTSELYEILDAHYPNMAGELHVEIISQLRSRSTKVCEAIDSIVLEYIMSPALKRIITPDHMTVYNDIWRLMLKVKWSVWKLENLRFVRRSHKDVYAPLDLLGLTLRRLEMIRFWLLYMVNNVHSHLCTHLVQQTGVQFEEQLKQMANIRQLVKLHHEYLMFLRGHCLVTDDLKSFRIALDQIFDLVYVLDMEWRSCGSYLNETHALSLALSSDNEPSLSDASHLDESDGNRAMEHLALNQVGEIEGTYVRCHQLMSEILTGLVYKNDVKFLNCLEAAISSSLPC